MSRSMTIFKTNRTQSTPGCMFGVNLMIPPQICDELSRRQADFPRILSQNDLEGQGQWYLFSKQTESITRCMFGADLAIPTQICDELSCRYGKVSDRQTDRQTDRQAGRETDGQTDRRRQRQHLFGLKDQGVMIVSLWNMTDISATRLSMCLSNFRAIKIV